MPTADADRSAQLDRIEFMLQGLVAHKEELRTLARLAAEARIRRRNKAATKARPRPKHSKKRS
jgi:hypothetical protein